MDRVRNEKEGRRDDVRENVSNRVGRKAYNFSHEERMSVEQLTKK